MRRPGAFLTVAVLASVLLAGPAGAVQHAVGTFHCRMSATKLGPRVEVTFRLRGSEAGLVWRVRMWNGGVRFADRTRVADASGRLKVVATTRNRPGPDEIVGIARDQVTGARCEVELSI
jgi:hypothetical protein